nr:proline-rich receptor-like protein kinase PERK2 [Ziziphus jujuba var. spinosa]
MDQTSCSRPASGSHPPELSLHSPPSVRPALPSPPPNITRPANPPTLPPPPPMPTRPLTQPLPSATTYLWSPAVSSSSPCSLRAFGYEPVAVVWWMRILSRGVAASQGCLHGGDGGK